MGQPQQVGGGFWRTLPGALTAAAGFITALTGLVLAAQQIGIFGGDGGGGSGQTRSAAAPPAVHASGDDPPDLPDVRVTADRIAGAWIGKGTRGHDQTFVVRLVVAEDCGRTQRCGSISVSDLPCKGDVYLDEVNEGTFEFSVDNFSPGSSASCRAIAGNYFTPQRNDTLRYRTGYDGGIAATLSRAPG